MKYIIEFSATKQAEIRKYVDFITTSIHDLNNAKYDNMFSDADQNWPYFNVQDIFSKSDINESLQSNSNSVVIQFRDF